MVCGFLASGCLLLLILVGDPADACMCQMRHPHHHYCDSNFVITGKFVSKARESRFVARYGVQISQVFKTSQEMKGTVFLSTASMESLCGYEHPLPFGEEEYLITGMQSRGDNSITLCNLILPWALVSPEQKNGIRRIYNKGCSCKIQACDPSQCRATSSECIWNLASKDMENMACIPKYGTCSWQSLRKRRIPFRG